MLTETPIKLSNRELDDMIKVTVQHTLTHIGIRHDDPIEMQKDFQHLRDWRKSTEEVKRKGMLTMVGVFITSMVAVIVLGIKEYFKG